MTKKCLLMTAFCLLLFACGSDQTSTNTSLQLTAQAKLFATPGFNSPTPQNPNVTAISFNLVEKLQAQGITVSSNGLYTTFTSIMQISGNSLIVNQEGLIFYEFPDSASANAIYISPDGGTYRNSNGATISIGFAKIGPHVYRKDNVIVLYVDENQTIKNALIAVMGNQIAGI